MRVSRVGITLMTTLQTRFAAAGLPLELRTVPLAWQGDEGAQAIVQMDIAREAHKRHAFERFRIYPGDQRNRLEVTAIDRGLMQLVLFVDEPTRAFEVHVSRRAVPFGAVVVRKERDSVVIEQRTSGRERHFLCGMDEQHLFIAMLPRPASSVLAAHDALRPEIVARAEQNAPEPTLRQGEWFFIAPPAEEARLVATLAKRTFRIQRRVGIADAAGIRRLGRPHVVDELVLIRGVPDPTDRSERIYVRGCVTHPDHRTLILPTWRQTVPNLEELEQPIEGVNWID
jgi:hypothetical protein